MPQASSSRLNIAVSRDKAALNKLARKGLREIDHRFVPRQAREELRMGLELACGFEDVEESERAFCYSVGTQGREYHMLITLYPDNPRATGCYASGHVLLTLMPKRRLH